MIKSALDLFLGKMIRRRTTRYLTDIASAPVRAARDQTTRTLASFRNAPGSQITIGKTCWGETVTVPAKEMLAAHSVITGGTGSGKTRFSMILIKRLIDTLPHEGSMGFGVLDPKGDLFSGTLLLLWQRICELLKTDPEAARELRRRIVIVDFSSRDPISSYNILAPPLAVESDFFAASRADLLLGLLPAGDGVSLGAGALLGKAILLLSEFSLPITWINDVLHDAELRARLLHRSQNDEVKCYFARQFINAPKQTVAALSRRMDALFSSDGVRLALSGTAAPDFRLLQDEGRIVLVNCFGESISRSVRQLLQGLVVSDIAQSIFTRTRKDLSFSWFCDEAQNFFITERLRDHMHDVLTMSRSFGSFVCYLTQNLGTAVSNTGLLHSLYSNVRWSFSMRGDPTDCSFLKPALPISGRKQQPRTDPFKEPTFYSLNDERSIELNAMASLPDRVGYFWLRPQSSGAMKITTADLVLPCGKAVDEAMEFLYGDVKFGRRVSRAEYEQQVAERNRTWREPLRAPGPDRTLTESYRRTRRPAP